MSRKPRPCSRCPKWQDGYCPIRAVVRPPDAPSCDYGRRAMNSETAMEFNRKKFGWKRRERRRRGEAE